MTQITFVGGGSTQWMPTLISDVANTPCLTDASVVLHDIDETRLARVAPYAEHVAKHKGIDLSVRTTTSLDEAVDGASFVVVCISTGGFDSMAIDLDVSARHGIRMPIGDSVGPAGISRAMRNIPVLVGIGKAMERTCPDAWLLNVTNPLTVLTRSVAKETSIRAVGLCHEITNARFFLSQLLGCGFFDLDLVVTGVNHLPIITGATVDGEDRWDALVAYAHGRAPDLDAPLPLIDRVYGSVSTLVGGPPDDDAHPDHWTKQAVVNHYGVNFELLRRYGALPAAGADHVAEFFANFLTEASQWGRRWGIELKTIERRRAHEAGYVNDLAEKLASDEVPQHRSPEMVTPVIESLITGEQIALPLNIPNDGQCPDIAAGAVVESICTVDGTGIHGRDVASAPAPLADILRRVSTSQECTVRAAVNGDRDELLAALFTDPISGRLDHDELVALRDDIVESTRAWLPQF
jgi:galacturan 1,4-alpha-galacturonidase